MKLGDVIESGIWVTGEETPEQREQFKADVRQAIDELCDEYGYVAGPVTFRELRPGESRVPPVPDHIQGFDVRLLAAESVVVGVVPQLQRRKFIGDLDDKDLHRLRAVTRRKYAEFCPGQVLTDDDCDDIIDDLGLESAINAVRASVNGGMVN